uniref:Uncharacterized protein n=1 Tax=Candidatus Kentrum sp. MB TaxID=2138164 RepID=A0A450XD58_9GAMM|nr:MAG: hypothetical protein BECKMB1821I_GA0114274_100280 [Candidatus Kentron sp. MB]
MATITSQTGKSGSREVGKSGSREVGKSGISPDCALMTYPKRSSLSKLMIKTNSPYVNNNKRKKAKILDSNQYHLIAIRMKI